MIESDIFRPLVALGFGFCFGASFYFLSYYKNSQPLKSIDKKLKDSPDESCCAREKPTSCADTGACCQTEAKTTTSGCGTGSCCSSKPKTESETISKKVERFGCNGFF